MAFIPIPDTAEVVMKFTLDGQQVANVHHFKNTSGWDEGSLNNLGTAVREWWEDNIRSSVPGTLTLTEILVTDLTEENGVAITVQEGLPISGSNSGAALPNNVTLAVKKGTGLAGRSFRGRTYHLQLTEDQVTMNTVASVVVAGLRDAYDALKEPLGALIPVNLCVASRTLNGVPRTTGICTEVTGIGIDATVDSQRRRLPGRGQ